MNEMLKVDMWDKFYFLYRKYNDHTIHCLLRYDGRIDEACLKNALRYVVAKAPILRSRFVNGFFKPVWEVCAVNEPRLLTVKDSSDPYRDAEIFLTTPVDETGDLQIETAVFRDDSCDVLCIRVNHMCMDGADFMYVIRKICAAYNEYNDTGECSIAIKNGPRDYKSIYSGFSPEERKKAIKRGFAVHPLKIPFIGMTRDDGGNRARMIRRDIDKERFAAMKAAGKRRGATVNDMITSAFGSALSDFLDIEEGKKLVIPAAMDLRKHIPGGDTPGISTNAGFLQYYFRASADPMKVFEDTAACGAAIRADKYRGLGALPLLDLAYRIFPQKLAEKVILLFYHNVAISLSNIGAMKSADLTLGGIAPTDCVITGSVKKKPSIQLAMISMDGVMAMTFMEVCNDRDERILNDFLDLFDAKLDELIAML